MKNHQIIEDVVMKNIHHKVAGVDGLLVPHHSHLEGFFLCHHFLAIFLFDTTPKKHGVSFVENRNVTVARCAR